MASIISRIIGGLKYRFHYVTEGRMTYRELFYSYIDRGCVALFRRNPHCFMRAFFRRRAGKLPPIVKGSSLYSIKDVKFPLLEAHDENMFYNSVLGDTFWSYMFCDDKYDEATVDRCDKFLFEGLYGLVNDKVNVTVNPGDIVIDAGAWIGDFAAYAAVKGATVYAFEPTDTTFSVLEKTAELNGNIIPVKMGLSDETTSATLFMTASVTSGSNTLMPTPSANIKTTIGTITIDDFVRKNNLPRVDFIKSDIEGFERRMLEGAQETLARFAPKLALCTYHLPDDPQVMEALIKKTNPKYNVVQKTHKLYASVPRE